MRVQGRQKALEQEAIANLCAIPKMPESILPHTVYVEEEGGDRYSHGIPIYTMYRLEEMYTNGNCMFYNAESREHLTCRHLHEISMDWLVTVWGRYLEPCAEQDIWKGNAVAFLKDRTGKPKEEITSFAEASWDKCQAYTDNLKALLEEDKDREMWIFSFPLDEFERNIPVGKITVNYKSNPTTWVEKMTPLELAANINDECFDGRNDWVRVIELPKQE